MDLLQRGVSINVTFGRKSRIRHEYIVPKNSFYTLGSVVHTANLEISSYIKSCRFQEVKNSEKL